MRHRSLGLSPIETPEDRGIESLAYGSVGRTTREARIGRRGRVIGDGPQHPPAGRRPGAVEPGDEITWKHAFERPEDILIVCAGGQAGSWSACLPGWGNKWTRSVTTLIDSP